MGSYFLLQGIFPTQGSNSCLLYCRWILYQLSHQDISPILQGQGLGIINQMAWRSFHEQVHSYCEVRVRGRAKSSLFFPPNSPIRYYSFLLQNEICEKHKEKQQCSHEREHQGIYSSKFCLSSKYNLQRLIYINAKILFNQNYEEIALEKWERDMSCLCVFSDQVIQESCILICHKWIKDDIEKRKLNFKHILYI